MLDVSARFRVAADVATREIEGGLLLVNLESGATWRLNQVGAAVARKLDGLTDVAAIVGDLDRRYGAGVARLERDVVELLVELQRHGLVEPVTTAR